MSSFFRTVGALCILAAGIPATPAVAQREAVQVLIFAVGKPLPLSGGAKGLGGLRELTKAEPIGQKLADHFTTEFDLRKGQVQLRASPKETTTEALKRVVNVVANRDEPTVVFLFVLAHGVAADLPYDGWAQDLIIVSSDIQEEDVQDHGLRGSWILNQLARLPGSSVAFVFFDTCQSGVFDESNLDEFKLRFNRGARRILLFASSGSDEKAYGFAFSEAILKEFRSSSRLCSYPRDSERQVNDALREKNGWGQSARVLIDYDNFCVNRLNRTSGQLFVANRYSRGVRLDFVDEHPRFESLNRGRQVSVSLQRRKHRIAVGPQGSEYRPQSSFEVDLKQEPFAICRIEKARGKAMGVGTCEPEGYLQYPNQEELRGSQ